MSRVSRAEADLAWHTVHLYLREFAELRGVPYHTADEFDELTSILEAKLDQGTILTGEDWWDDEQ